MCIRHMGVRVAQRLVPVRVAVLGLWHGMVGVQVVPIVMAMGVLVLQRVVVMFMSVRLGHVQHHTSRFCRSKHKRQSRPCSISVKA